MTTKLLWHSNAPWAPTGYGQQTALFTPILAERYDTAISAFYALEGAPIKWEGIPVLPGLGGDFGNGVLPQHAKRFFGEPRDGIVFMLADVWPFDPEMARQLNLVCWTPVDHDPPPPKVLEFLIRSEAIPMAMSRFGEALLGRLDPLYVPHAVDCEVLKPLSQKIVREKSFPDGAWVVGMVAANKGRPSRKSFAQALAAFARFAADHDDAYLYLHTLLDPNHGNGENLPQLCGAVGIPEDRIRVADQYTMAHNPYSTADMAKIYSSLDVLMNPSMGEGFGIPVLEAQACGVPVIVTDFTAMPELCGAGWKVKHQPYWTGLGSWQATPDIDDIVSALDECYGLKDSQRAKLALAARRHAVQYDIRRVAKRYMLPALKIAEQRFADRTPIRIPSRLRAVAA